MTYPTTNQLDALLDQVKLADRKTLLRVLNEAIAREQRGGRLVNDGYPESSMNDGRGNSEFTSVEAAANRKPQRDIHRENLNEALAYLNQAIQSIHAFTHRVTNLRELTGEPPPPRCEITLADAAHFSDVAGRLHRNYHLSQAAYDFVRTHGRIPNEAERESYRRGYGWQRHTHIDPTSPAPAPAPPMRMAPVASVVATCGRCGWTSPALDTEHASLILEEHHLVGGCPLAFTVPSAGGDA